MIVCFAHVSSPGDCCACTCGASGEELAHSCREQGGGFDCQDPDVPADCGVTPSPAAAFGYPDCPGFMGYWQDSYCDDDLNNAACGYDGGERKLLLPSQDDIPRPFGSIDVLQETHTKAPCPREPAHESMPGKT